MLMRNREYRVERAQEGRCDVAEPLVDYAPREMLLGQFVLILLFLIAILLRSMT